MKTDYGFFDVATLSPNVSVGNPQKNLWHMIAAWTQMMAESKSHPAVCVYPELCITGYTCKDLFRSHHLRKAANEAILNFATFTKNKNTLFLIGAPLGDGRKLYNCAIAVFNGEILGVVPKKNIPNYGEFEESRWFRAGKGKPSTIFIDGYEEVPFGNLLFRMGNAVVHTEICEDLWMPIPPSSYAALAGANILTNLSASNETIGKDEYRSELIRNQSGRCMAAYVYASAGPEESTTDVVFSGACQISENGSDKCAFNRLDEPSRHYAIGTVDLEKLEGERLRTTSFGEAQLNRKFKTIEVNYETYKEVSPCLPKGFIDGMPFVPRNPEKLEKRCKQIFFIQAAGLKKRVDYLESIMGKKSPVYIGISGGLDSTLALLVAVKALPDYRERVRGITMPGFGTTSKTLDNAIALMQHLGIQYETIDIRPACMEQFRALNHAPFGSQLANMMDVEEFSQLLKAVPKEKRHDLVFENVQARQRTMILMSRGFVIGTGDMSELALGWCTYNGDHMSMYNPNCSIPKTLVKFLVEYVRNYEYNHTHAGETLDSILKTTISPELLPTNDAGEIEQSTEDVLGPYVLNDFYLFHLIRNGFSPEKMLYLARNANFPQEYSDELKVKTLKSFLKRFFTQQFKRSCVPDGPKVGSVSLSPRGDWRMSTDTDPSLWELTPPSIDRSL